MSKMTDLVKKVFEWIKTRVKELTPRLISDISLLSLGSVQEIVVPNIRITFDYLLLITAACIVSTLGLLMNSTPVIVGGMIISPLMWPIVGISYGLWQSKSHFLWKSIRLLSLSVVFTLLTSALLTFFSPIKIINSEILGRTTPTLFDLIVALASGAVAMLSLTNKRVSNSIAGVAIATSLLPPICVSGIGIAVWTFSIFWGGLLLFITNAVAIITVGVIYLTFVSVVQNKALPKINFRGAFIFIFLLIILIAPLKQTLIQYGWNVGSLQTSRSIIIRELSQLDSKINLIDIQVNDRQYKSRSIILVNIGIMVPQGYSITFDTKEALRKKLEDSLGKHVELNIRVQESVSILSVIEEQDLSQKNTLTDTLRTELSKMHKEIVIDSINIEKKDNWKVRAMLTIDPSNPLTEKDRRFIETKLSKSINRGVTLSLDLIPRIKLGSDKDAVKNNVQSEINTIISAQFPDVDIVAVSLGMETKEATSSAILRQIVMVQLRVPVGKYKTDSLAKAVRQGAQKIIPTNFILQLRVTPVEDLIF